MDDDEEFSLRPRRKSRSSRVSRGSSNPTLRRPKTRIRDEEEPILDDRYSDSDSDGDWEADHGKRSHRRRRRSAVSKRYRTSPTHEDEEAARNARVNNRTGGVINYFEGDGEDDFLASDQEAASKMAEEAEEHDNSPHVDSAYDYRRMESANIAEKGEEADSAQPSSQSGNPYSDFNVATAEFRIKWTNKCFRKSTWETWETLKNVRGAKRVSNFIKFLENRRDYFGSDDVAPEEIEEARVMLEEYRTTHEEYEVVERIFAQRDAEGEEGQTEYLVKWFGLSYSSSTWEPRSDMKSEADLKAIDDFIDREQSLLTAASKKRFNPFNMKDDRPRMKRMMEQPSYLHGDGRTLRDYQLSGLNFLAFSWVKRNNVILADEMGLGKTLQTISFLGWLMYVRNIHGPFLVVVPLSTITAWVREFARWLPDMNVICYTGDAKSRATIREFEFYSPSTKAEKFHVLLTTPELMMMDGEHIHSFRWAMIAVDEAHRLKNETSAFHTTLASLKSANRLLITGTPLQNSVRELWALLHFLNPAIFQSAEEFEDKFSFTALRDPERVSSLHNTLRPYIIRRQKSDVEKSLPKKTYAVLRVGMTTAQQQYYRWLLTRNFAKLNSTGKARGIGNSTSIRNLLMELKKCCNHPFLFPNYEDTSTPTSVNDLIRASGKMILLDKLLTRLKEKGHRVLIFSQMVRMLDILQDYCRMRNFPFQRLDGNVANEARQRAVDHFNAPDSIDYIFLLSTRAGGLGINLATADTVIIFDSDWNPQNDLQAESRAHRIGQKKDVKVFRLLAGETVEEDILERAKRKRVLEHVVIHGVEGGNNAEGKEGDMTFKKEELSAILRFGAEKLFAKDRITGSGQDEKAKGPEIAKGEPDPTAPTQGVSKEESEAKAEERKILASDDIDELLARAPDDDIAQVGADQPSIGASLLNAFKWNDFKTVEEEEEGEQEDTNDAEENKKMALEAANRMIAIDKDVITAQEREKIEKEKHAKEGDVEFWDRVIPDDMRDQALAGEVVLGTRRRKRTKQFSADSPRGEKRRRVTRGARLLNGKVSDVDELSDKEQRSLLRSLKKFGDPNLIEIIIKDAGLQDRIDEGLAKSLLRDCLLLAKEAVEGPKIRRKEDDEDDPEYGGSHYKKGNIKELKNKSNRVPISVLGETDVDALDLLKRCEDLKMLRSHIESFEVDTQFRLSRVIKPPAYNVKWKSQNDAMLLVGVYRYGLGNWTQIAQDKQLNLSDKMNVSGNPLSKPGAPDTTKLTRRIGTLLKEIEKDRNSRLQAKKPRSAGKSAKVSDKKNKRTSGPQKKISKKSKLRPEVNGNKRSRRKHGGAGKIPGDNRSRRILLKTSHLSTLRQLRALSKESNTLENQEKIRRTKACLLELGRAIDKQAGSSQAIKDDLWRYVHDVCHTSLAEDRLQAIYQKLASAIEVEDEVTSR